MKKRVSPLETANKKQEKFVKRVNPLTLGASDQSPKVDTYVIRQDDKLKRKLFLTTLSKDLLSKLKTLYPDDKLKVVLENLMLKDIQQRDLTYYNTFVKSIDKGDK